MDVKLQVESLTDQVYEILKQKIMSKQFPPGMRLIDSQLADEFGISRTPLRDAIRRLYEDGLVTSNSGRGYSVFQPTENDVNEIFEIRKMIDIAAAKKLIEDVLPNDEKAYATIKEFYNQFSEEFEPEGFLKADENFHDRIVLLTGNKRTYNFYKEIRNQTRTFRLKTSSDRARIAKACKHHERICKGLLDLDLNATTIALADHIEHCRQDAIRDLA